jgi:hypothetical protein
MSSTRAGLEVYLFPAVVGGGWGDIEEVLLAGRALARDGHPVLLYRRPGHPMPRSVDGPFAWPPVRRLRRLRPRAPRALTISAWWGVAAAPGRDEPYGRPGPWAEECAEIERAYGAENVLHVSFEEFARTYTSRAQTAERWREGGVPLREIRRRLAASGTAAEVETFRAAYAKFRGFAAPNVLHLYPGFGARPAFRREFPAAVVCGPFWPEPVRPRPRPRRDVWVWYASPGSSGRLAERIARELRPGPRGPVTLEVRSPQPLELPPGPGVRWVPLPALPNAAWRRRMASAELRIVTGSRTLLEAIVDGGPFVYFNGVSGRPGAERRHRPEKIEALLRAYRRQDVPRRIRRDLAEFSRLRSVGAVLVRASRDPRWRAAFPRELVVRGFPPPCDSAAELLRDIAQRFRARGGPAASQIARLRTG